MIVLSVGMPRAGSGWYYNLTRDLLLSSGHQDGRRIRKQYRLELILTEVNCNIGALTTRRLLPVLLPSLLGNTFAVKAHSAPTSLALRLIDWKQIRATYIYRDPRDALLSAFEHGERSRQNGHTNAFAELTTFEKAIDFMLQYLQIWDQWIACLSVLHARYEYLLSSYEDEVNQLIEFLDINIDRQSPHIQEVIERYRPEQARSADQPGLHFRKGKIGRYRKVFTPEQQEFMNDKFKPYLLQMDYPLE